MERKALSRNLEKHAKAVDALKEQETSLTQQLVRPMWLSAHSEANFQTDDYSKSHESSGAVERDPKQDDQGSTIEARRLSGDY